MGQKIKANKQNDMKDVEKDIYSSYENDLERRKIDAIRKSTEERRQQFIAEAAGEREAGFHKVGSAFKERGARDAADRQERIAIQLGAEKRLLRKK